MSSEDAEHSEWETVAADDSSMSSHSRLTRNQIPFMGFSSENTHIQGNVNHVVHRDGERKQLRQKAAEEGSLCGRIDQLQETVIELCDKVAALSKAIYSQQETISKLASLQDRSIAVFFTDATHEINMKTAGDAKVYSRSIAVQTAPMAEINTDVIPEVVGTSQWEACWYGTTSGMLPSKKQNWQCIRGRRSNCRSGRILNDRLSASVTSTLNNDLCPALKAQLEEWGCCSSEDDGTVSSAPSVIYQAERTTNTSFPPAKLERFQIPVASAEDTECDDELWNEQ